MNKVLLFILVISMFGIFFLDQNTIYLLSYEDGPIESLGAAYFLISSCLLLTTYFKSSGSGNSFGKFHTKRNIFYFLLGLSLFICFGEEISWGQRIIGWDTPTMLEEANLQNETNLHNLDIFILGRFNLVFMFTVLTLSYFILIPLLNKFVQRASEFFNHINLPIPPLWFGGLFLISDIIVHIIPFIDLGFKVSGMWYHYQVPHEIKETNYAFCYAVFGIQEFRKVLS